MWNFGESKRIYLDHAAATPVDREVLEAMRPYFSEWFGNPGSVHEDGVRAKKAVEDSRNAIAVILHAHPDELIFTSGGTEANNMVVRGLFDLFKKDAPGHIITSNIEHPSILEPIKKLEGGGVSATYLDVESNGCVNPKSVQEAIKEDTKLVSIMFANNEIGSVQPIVEIMKVVRKYRKENGSTFPYMHVDASQAPLYFDLNVEKLGIDLMTLDAQKLYGPKGVGLLYKRRGVNLLPLIEGGDQESTLRAGTENVPLVVGFSKAYSLADARREDDNAHLCELRDYFLERTKKELPGVSINGSIENRVPNNVNISLKGIESAYAVLWLDARGISCGSRSACMRGDDSPSYVIKAIGGTDEVAKSSIRFTLGRKNSKADINRTIKELKAMQEKLTKEE